LLQTVTSFATLRGKQAASSPQPLSKALYLQKNQHGKINEFF